MGCDAVRAALIDGRPLDGRLADHLAACPACRATVALTGTAPRIDAAIPLTTASTLRGRARRQDLARGALALAAAALVGWVAWPSAPEPPALAALPDTGALALDLAEADPLAAEPGVLRLEFEDGALSDLASPTDLFETALLGQGAL